MEGYKDQDGKNNGQTKTSFSNDGAQWSSNKKHQKTGKGNYELTIEVIPPPVNNASMKAFVDTIVVKTRQAGPAEITCIGYYAAKTQQPADANKK